MVVDIVAGVANVVAEKVTEQVTVAETVPMFLRQDDMFRCLCSLLLEENWALQTLQIMSLMATMWASECPSPCL